MTARTSLPMRTRVAIVGAGPTGATLALLLARHGVPSVVVDRLQAADGHPRGNVWSARSMEVLRSIDIDLSEEMREISPPPLKLRYVTWCTSLAGVDLGRCVPVGEDAAYTSDLLSASPCRPILLSQNVADPLLRDALRRHDAITFLEGHEVEALQESTNGVSVHLSARASGRASGGPGTLQADWLVGADGAASTVRRLLGIESTTTDPQPMAQIHFRADLSRFTVARPSALFWVLSPGVVGTLVPHTKDEREWVLTTAVLPAVAPAEAMPAAVARRLVAAAIGDAGVPVEIVSVRGWTMALREPARYGTRRVMLAGDAAMGFTAIGGFGLNHGIQDASSLAWRLALLACGPADGAAARTLLDTYQAERLAVGRWTAQRARHLAGVSDRVLAAAGLDPAGFAILTRLSQSRATTVLPRRARLALFDRLLAAGLKPLATLAADSGAGRGLRARVGRAIATQREVFLGLGTDLGWRLHDGFVCPEAQPAPTAPDEHTHYCPTSSPGSLIPHLWSEGDSPLSVRDLVRDAPITLLVPEDDAPRWTAALQTVRDRSGLDVVCASVGASPRAAFKVAPARFAEAMDIESAGALLVRGDGIVVWRSRSFCTDPRATLQAVFDRLGSPATTPTLPSPLVHP